MPNSLPDPQYVFTAVLPTPFLRQPTSVNKIKKENMKSVKTLYARVPYANNDLNKTFDDLSVSRDLFSLAEMYLFGASGSEELNPYFLGVQNTVFYGIWLYAQKAYHGSPQLLLFKPRWRMLNLRFRRVVRTPLFSAFFKL